MKAFNGKIGDLVHVRKPTTPDNQPVIRMNQDTLYTGVVLDLSKPAKITLPEIGGRYMSMHVISQDHHMFVESKPETYNLTEDSVGTRFAYVIIRTFYNAGDSDDLPITKGWNYAVRMYRPRKEILDGSWTFPSIKPAK